MSDYDRENWQAEQIAHDQAQSAYSDKMARARERSAANAKRKIARLHAKLTELGHISEFEDEFGESVLERLDKFGSAFHDREKGRAGDALSIAQKQVVARMNKKVKDLRKKRADDSEILADPDADYIRTADRWKNDAKDNRKRNGFKSNRKPKFEPRVRHIEDDIVEDEIEDSVMPVPFPNLRLPKLGVVSMHSDDEIVEAAKSVAPYIPEYEPPARTDASVEPPRSKRPFLKLVPKAD